MLASIVESSHDAIIGQTLDGVISSWNPGAERLLGYSAGEIIGRPVDMLIPDGRRADEMAVLERIVRGDRVEQYDTERLRKDGSVVAVSLTMSPIGEATIVITGAASVSREIVLPADAVRDVTERIESEWNESRLHRSQRLESLGQRAGGVAHDVDNLLAVILDHAGVVADEVTRARDSPGGEHWDAVCRDVEQIQQAAERATRLTGQLLAVGRREVHLHGAAPVTEEAVRHHEGPAHPARTSDGETVLPVEDEDAIPELIGWILARHEALSRSGAPLQDS
ncbi:MAG: cckA [Chloroflexi bacterium]|jgi:two-component system cell cycle sensor histidine kinase/response regulator CckA|nr:cckA [Chloroflexota bacterium]